MATQLSDVLAQIQERFNLSQSEMARRGGMSHAAFWQALKGKTVPRYRNLETLLSSFGINLPELILSAFDDGLTESQRRLVATARAAAPHMSEESIAGMQMLMSASIPQETPPDEETAG